MSSPPKQDQRNSYTGESDRLSSSSRGSLTQRRAERGVDVPVSFSELRRPSTSSVTDAFGFDHYAFGGVSPIMSSSFSAIAEERAYFVPSPYDQRPEYLQRYPSLRSRYERERRASRKWNRQSDLRPRDSTQEFSDLANQRDTETDESDIEMPDDDLTGMSPDDVLSAARSPTSHNYPEASSHNPAIPPQLPVIRPESFSFSFDDAINKPKTTTEREGDRSHTSLDSYHPTATVNTDKSKMWLKSIHNSAVDNEEPNRKDKMTRRSSTMSESPVSQTSPLSWLKDNDALAKMKSITSGLREQKLDDHHQDHNEAQRNTDSFFSMAKKVDTTNLPKPAPNPINVPRPRKFLLQTAVFQVINANTVKDRYLFLFNDLLFIAKPIMDESIMSERTSTNARGLSEDGMSGHAKFGDNHKYRFRPTKNSLYQVKNIVELSKVTLYVARDYEAEPLLLKTGVDGQVVLPPPRKIHPILASALRKFESDPNLAITYLMDKKILLDDPISTANFLFKTADLNRRQLGRYISNADNSNVFHAFLDCFRLQGMRLDEALRTFLITFRLPSKFDAMHYTISTFAKKWYDSNQNVVKFHEDMIVKVIYAMLRLNSFVWHDRDVEQDVFLSAMDRREQKLPTVSEQQAEKLLALEVPKSIPTCNEFLERWAVFDQYNLVPKEFMVRMYNSIRDEKMETGWDHKYQTEANTDASSSFQEIHEHEEPELVISVLPDRLPTRLTKGIPSSKIIIYIPEADPDLQIKLRGQDLVCEPSVLDFSTSRMQTFTITGSTLGRTSLMFIKSGSRAGRYVSPALPRTKAIVVERSFMRHTFQIGFYQTEVKEQPFDQARRRSSVRSPNPQDPNTGENRETERPTSNRGREILRTKRKYMFSVESEEALREWVNQLRTLCGHVNREGHHQISSRDTVNKTPEDLVSLQVLKEVLLADEAKRGLMGLRSITVDKRASLLNARAADTPSSPSGSDVGLADEENGSQTPFLKPSKLLASDTSSKSLSAATAANVVAKRGHEIIKLAVQNSLMPTMLGFLKHSLDKS